MGFSRQEYWRKLPCPPPGGLPHPRIKPSFPALAGGSFTPEQGSSLVVVHGHCSGFFCCRAQSLEHSGFGNCSPRAALEHWLSSYHHVPLFATSWTAAGHAPLSMELSRQAYWSGLPFPSPRVLRYPGIEPMCLTSPAWAGVFFTTSATWEALHYSCKSVLHYTLKSQSLCADTASALSLFS